MLLEISQLLKSSNFSPTNILHLGAHKAEELQSYLDIGVKKENIYWVEGNPELIKDLQEKCGKNNVIENLIYNIDNKEIIFYINTNSQCSSVLELKDHKVIYPYFLTQKQITGKTITIDTIQKKINKKIDLLVMDLQGAELLALEGADEALHNIQAIYTEVNFREMYKNCAMIEKLDIFLYQYGFYRKETNFRDDGWGDAFYIKKPFNVRNLSTHSYENGEDYFWKLIQKRCNVVFDIGAYDSHLPNKNYNTTFFLFEPMPDRFRKLKQKYDTENYPKVILEQLCISTQNIVKFYKSCTSVFNRNNEDNDKNSLIMFPIHLDEYCHNNGITHIDFLKIDTEGSELDVLESCRGFIKNIDCIQFEYGGTYKDANITLKQVINHLKNNGFTYFYLLNQGYLLPIDDNNILEHYNYSNYIALKTTWKKFINQPKQKIRKNIECRIINLERSYERRCNAILESKKIPIKTKITKAVDKNILSIINNNNIFEIITETNDKYYYRYSKKHLSLGEIACSISHRRCYEELIKDNENDAYLILEDDTYLLDSGMLINQLKNIPDYTSFDICQCSASIDYWSLIHTIPINEYYTHFSKRIFNRANAYIITKRGATKLLKTYPYIELSADDLLFDCMFKHNYSLIATKNPVWKLHNINDVPSDIWSGITDYSSILAERKPLTQKNKKLVSFFYMGNYARLGNQMFQYALMKSYAIKHGAEIVLDKKSKVYLQNYFRGVSWTNNIKEILEQDFEIYKELPEKECKYDEMALTIKQNKGFSGYFMNFKYFENIKQIIIETFKFDNNIYENSLMKINNYYKNFNNEKLSLVGIHIRLSDIENAPFIYNEPSQSFINRAIKILKDAMPNKILLFIIFSSDIIRAQKKYKINEPHFFCGINDNEAESMCMMTLCNHLILSAGSFGWWGAYLNKNIYKKVICMTPWFNKEIKHIEHIDESELLYPGWISLEN